MWFLLFFATTLFHASSTRIIAPQFNSNHVLRRASKDLRRFLYEMTDEVPHISTSLSTDQTLHIYLGHIHSPLVKKFVSGDTSRYLEAYSPGKHWIKHIPTIGVLCAGRDDTDILYCVYSLLELLGVRFRIDSDIVPSIDSTRFNSLDEFLHDRFVENPIDMILSPKFSLRGSQPFHDFAEGPDWWDETDYKLLFDQLGKMKMNFIGLHTYPVREPTVWTGLETDFDQNTGDVTKSYSTSYMNTLGYVGGGSHGGDWGGIPMNTSKYTSGVSKIYHQDCFGNTVFMSDTTKTCPYPKALDGDNEVFNKIGQLLSTAFKYAKKEYQFKTCVGTETPLRKPPGQSSGTALDYYKGIFKRINVTYPIDYYWLWTPESWQWSNVNVTNPIVANAVADMKMAYQAITDTKVPFKLATCGWTLGPMNAEAYLDQVLPKDVPLSSIDPYLGWSAPYTAYAKMTDRDTWSIPWMEDDPGLSALQLWVNRTLSHGVLAQSYHVNGFFGIHWHTRAISPQFSALAQFGWNAQSRNIISHPSQFALSSNSLSMAFWMDFVSTEFSVTGTVATQMAQLMDSIDSFNLPRQKPPRGSDDRLKMGGCPGWLSPNTVPWSQIEGDWKFVDQISSFSSKITDPAAKERFDYWVNYFEYFRMMAIVGCDWGVFEQTMQKISKTTDPAQQKQMAEKLALPQRKAIVQDATKMVNFYLATTQTPGSFGTLTNMQQVLFPQLLYNYEKDLMKYLDVSVLPSGATMPMEFTGRDRVVVRAPRASVMQGEYYRVRALVMTSGKVDAVQMMSRDMGSTKPWNLEDLLPFGDSDRNVYQTTVERKTDFEYFVVAKVTMNGKQLSLRWPENTNKTVVVV